MKIINFLVVLIILIPCAFAGQETGNGGDAIVCRNSDGEVIKAEFYDLWEANQLYGKELKHDLGGSELTIISKLEIVFTRLEKFSPVRAKAYRKASREFLNNKLMVENLRDIDDSNHHLIPGDKNCKLEQVIVQVNPRFQEEKAYKVKKDVYEKFTKDSIVAAILHEILWKESMAYHKHKDSTHLRYLNIKLLSNQLESYDYLDFLNLLVVSKFYKTDMIGLTVSFLPGRSLGGYSYRQSLGKAVKSAINYNFLDYSNFNFKKNMKSLITLSEFGYYKVYAEKNGFPFIKKDFDFSSYLIINKDIKVVGIQTEGDELPRGEEQTWNKILLKKEINGQALELSNVRSICPLFFGPNRFAPMSWDINGRIIFASVKRPKSGMLKDSKGQIFYFKKRHAFVQWNERGEISWFYNLSNACEDKGAYTEIKI